MQKRIVLVLAILFIASIAVFAQDASTTTSDDLFAGVDGTELSEEQTVIVLGGYEAFELDPYEIAGPYLINTAEGGKITVYIRIKEVKVVNINGVAHTIVKYDVITPAGSGRQ